MSNWPNNDVWEERDTYNRAPRLAITECEPLNHRKNMGTFLSFLYRFVVVCVLGGTLAAVGVSLCTLVR